MAAFDTDELHSLINLAVHPNGPQGKTTAPGLNALLHRMTNDLAAASSTGAATPGTYAELAALVQQQQLVTGAGYLLTDFTTKYMVAETNVIQAGAVEPLLLLASGPQTFAVVVASPTYPTDVIYYDFGANFSEDNSKTRPGHILYRQDPLTGQSAYYDWRAMGLTSQPNSGSIPAVSYGKLQFTAPTDGAQAFALPSQVFYACLFDVAVIEQPAQLVRSVAQPHYALSDDIQQMVSFQAEANIKQGDVVVLSYVTTSAASNSGPATAGSAITPSNAISALGYIPTFADSHYNRVKLTHYLPVTTEYNIIKYDTPVAGSAISDGVFTAPVAGLWCFATTTILQGHPGQWYLSGQYRCDGVEVDKFVEGTLSFATDTANTYVSNAYLYVRAGQQVTPVIKSIADNATTGLNVLGFEGNGEYTTFTAFLLFPDTVANASGVGLDFAFNAGFADSFTTVATRNQVATYTTQALSNVANATYAVNGTTVGLPFTLAIGDALHLTITRLDDTRGAVVSLAS